MSETPHLGLPLIAAAQAQKHVTHNEALGSLDALTQLSVISRALATPPGSPAEGDRYIVAASPSGDWSGRAGHVARYDGGAWTFHAPREGWRAWIADEDALLVWTGADWQDVGAAIGTLQNLDLLGVNTTADAANKLAVRSNALLFTALYDADGGDGSVQLKVNKEAAADTASLLFQTGFSGRAEVGLTGDDDFHFKVSPNGSAWTDAVVIDKDDGQAKFIDGSAAAPSISFQSDPTTGIYRSSAGQIGVSLGGTLSALFFSSGGSSIFFVQSASFASNDVKLVTNNANGPQYRTQKTRGTLAANTGVNSGDVLGAYVFQGHDGSSLRDGAMMRGTVIEASPSSSAFGTRILWLSCPVGSATLTEIMRLDHATGLSLFGANPVINQNRHFRPRQYAAGSLPSQNAGDLIASSDIAAALLVSDGTEWLSPGVKRLRAVTANATVSIPAGWAIDAIHYAETAGNAVSGGIRIGTTSGGGEVVAAQAVAGNDLGSVADAAILKKVFSRAAAQTLHIQAVTAWNAASVELSFVLKKVF